MVTARLGQMATLSPRRLAEQPLRRAIVIQVVFRVSSSSCAAAQRLYALQCTNAAIRGRKIMILSLPRVLLPGAMAQMDKGRNRIFAFFRPGGLQLFDQLRTF
jgi:hypothetical protein